MKRHLVLSVLLSVAFLSSLVFAYSGPGSGTIEAPYEIWTADQLHEMSIDSEYWDDNWILKADIDLTQPGQMQPEVIGTYIDYPFIGTFDGGGHSITGLQKTATDDYVAMFGFVGDYSANPKICNLTLIEPKVIVEDLVLYYISALCCRTIKAEVTNCNIVDCEIILSNHGSIQQHTGGAIGGSQDSLIQDVHCSGTVNGGRFDTGGLIGMTSNDMVINCSFEGNVAGGYHTGGFVGTISGSTVLRCYSQGTINAPSTMTGGFAGLIHRGNDSSTYVKDCYASGIVNGDHDVGGFIGYSRDSNLIKNCYSACSVSGTQRVGGFCGNHEEPEGYSNTEYVGCFWDIELNTSVLSISNYESSGIAYTSTADLQDQDFLTIAGWDFAGETSDGYDESWKIETPDSYPTLEPAHLIQGSGTADDPYLIYSAYDLFGSFFSKAPIEFTHIKLMNDIDLAGGKCQTVFDESGFRGIFDGNGKSIINMHMEDTAGLMRRITGSGSVLKDLTLINPIYYSDNPDIYAGLLVASVERDATVENCHVINAVIETTDFVDYDNNIYGTRVGGIARGNVGMISNCSFSGSITGALAGGIANENYTDGVIENCTADVDIEGLIRAGGIAAYNRGTINYCRTSGKVVTTKSDWAEAGGIVGEGYGQNASLNIIYDCHSSCEVISGGKAGGGIFGSIFGGTVSFCSATGDVSGHSYLGGLGGVISTTTAAPYMTIVMQCFSTGNVSGHDRIGGLLGESGSGKVKNCYTTGDATGTEIVGGFLSTNYLYPYNGYGDAVIKKCWSIGKVTAGSEKGGFVGRHWNQPLNVVDCFWNTQLSGLSYSSGGTGLTTVEMLAESTYTDAGWDFATVWAKGASYPFLQWEIGALQEQIDAAVDGDTIVVEPGVYRGKLYFKGKNITLVSSDPADADVVAATVLEGVGVGPVVTFAGTEDDGCVLEGFTITGGTNVNAAGGGIFGNSCTATIRNCVIEGNQVIGSTGGGVWGIDGLIENCVIRNNIAASGGGLTQCNGVIVNCLIVNNQGGTLRKCNGTISNCTIVGESSDPIEPLKACDAVIENCILQTGAGVMFNNSNPTIRYSCYPGATGEGNIDSDPQFANAAQGNYHLAGSSPCVDAGDPASDYSNEPLPNGGRVNMGAYGNTAEAAVYSLAGDITGDGDVNMKDFAILASQWQQTPSVPSADIALPLDGFVGMEDLIYLAENWLAADAE